MWNVTAFICILIGASIPLGLFDASFVTGLVGAATSLGLLASLMVIRPGELSFLKSVAGPAVTAALVPVLWIILQMLPLPFLAHPVWKFAGETLGAPLSGSITIDTGASLGALLVWLSLLSVMPPAHLAFLRSLPICYVHSRYFFVHAGVRPGIALNQQRREDLLWIRDDFLMSEDDFGKVVVHGHTPVHEAELLHNRINVDTGAYATGRLTCVKLEGARRSLMMTGDRAARHG